MKLNKNRCEIDIAHNTSMCQDLPQLLFIPGFLPIQLIQGIDQLYQVIPLYMQVTLRWFNIEMSQQVFIYPDFFAFFHTSCTSVTHQATYSRLQRVNVPKISYQSGYKINLCEYANLSILFKQDKSCLKKCQAGKNINF